MGKTAKMQPLFLLRQGHSLPSLALHEARLGWVVPGWCTGLAGQSLSSISASHAPALLSELVGVTPAQSKFSCCGWWWWWNRNFLLPARLVIGGKFSLSTVVVPELSVKAGERLRFSGLGRVVVTLPRWRFCQ